MNNVAFAFILILMVIFVLGAFVLLFLSIWKNRHTAFQRGEEGEASISALLDELVDESSYVLNDLVIDEGGIHTQIDHLFISLGGIVVIETKNLSGRIYGKDNSAYWLQVLRNGKKYKIYSPILQNETHMRAIRTILKENGYQKIELLSSIVLVKGNTEFIKSSHVYSPYTLKRYIRSIKNDVIYSEEEINRIYDLLKKYQNNK